MGKRTISNDKTPQKRSESEACSFLPEVWRNPVTDMEFRENTGAVNITANLDNSKISNLPFPESLTLNKRGVKSSIGVQSVQGPAMKLDPINSASSKGGLSLIYE